MECQAIEATYQEHPFLADAPLGAIEMVRRKSVLLIHALQIWGQARRPGGENRV
jgi:hypothetical protein